MNGFNSAIVKCADYKDEHLPNSLHKFFPPTTHSLIALENGIIWLSTPNSFNDPFDGYVGVEKNTYTKNYILRELKRRHLVVKEATQDKISEEEYWSLFHSHSEDRELGLFGTKNRTQ